LQESQRFENHPNSVFAGGPSGPIYEAVKNIFVRNGDRLSLQYTGTDSNISRVTKGASAKPSLQDNG
ncbi:MAG: hypothetical protein AAFU03_13000, partial [Bacteroidota bacterium]